MDEGRIVDMGAHHELLTRCGLYGRLYQTEFRESA
jgi:ABC-type multidrug transport system fused ATPase/permease subunit